MKAGNLKRGLLAWHDLYQRSKTRLDFFNRRWKKWKKSPQIFALNEFINVENINCLHKYLEGI